MKAENNGLERRNRQECESLKPTQTTKALLPKIFYFRRIKIVNLN